MIAAIKKFSETGGLEEKMTGSARFLCGNFGKLKRLYPGDLMRFIQVRSFDNYISAHICMGMLQDAGINCHLNDEYTITLDPFLSPAIGGMKLMVFSSQLERAVELLEGTEERV